MKKVIFVCTGNTCRSPMAEAFLIDVAIRNRNDKLQVLSRGLSVTDRSMSEKALKSLSKFGIINYTHIPTQLSIKDVEEADLVLTMTKSQKEYMLKVKPFQNVFSIGEYISASDIADPYGQDQSTYDYVAGIIKDSCEKIYKKLF